MLIILKPSILSQLDKLFKLKIHQRHLRCDDFSLLVDANKPICNKNFRLVTIKTSCQSSLKTKQFWKPNLKLSPEFLHKQA